MPQFLGALDELARLSFEARRWHNVKLGVRGGAGVAATAGASASLRPPTMLGAVRAVLHTHLERLCIAARNALSGAISSTPSDGLLTNPEMTEPRRKGSGMGSGSMRLKLICAT